VTTPSSRLSVDPSTLLPTISSFGELSSFLRNSVADEDCRQLSESMGRLSVQIESIIETLRSSRSRDKVAPLLVDLLTTLRVHRAAVVNLGLAWRGLYEYAAYLQALNNFRVLIGQWLLDGAAQGSELRLDAEDFELMAWRTLGEGMLMIDMYEQWVSSDQDGASTLGALTQPQIQRAVHWWKKLRR
jgi:hypothetical protein